MADLFRRTRLLSTRTTKGSGGPNHRHTIRWCLRNIDAINQVKTQVFGLPAENLIVLRDSNTDNGFARVDHNFNSKNYLLRGISSTTIA